MPAYVVERTTLALNGQGKAAKGSRVLVIGLAYKADVDDTRESPSFELIERLRVLGADVEYHDPHIPATIPVRRHDLRMRSVPLTAESVAGFDAVLIATAHSAVDYNLLARHARLVVDTRDAMRPYAPEMGARLVRA
jgi:UDP-N-acetyl-D-glucosamine dehydrogenase